MATNKKLAPNIDNSDLVNYPDGRIRDNSGAGDGTPVNRLIYSDLHEFFAKIMRTAEIAYNGLPENTVNGYQLVDAVIALAGKNDYVYNLSTVTGVINISTKTEILQDGETLLCQSTFDFSTETQIKGTGPGLRTISVPSDFKTGDYILLIVNTGGSVTLVRLATSGNIDALAEEAGYLKAATEAEEYAGAINDKATTPYHNSLAYARRTIGLDSGMFLASTIRNGLLSKEDKALIDGLVNPVKNVGWFSGVDVGGGTIGAPYPRSGDVVSAILASVSSGSGAKASYITVTIANNMTGTNYFVRISIQSEGTMELDNDILCPIFKPLTNNTFTFSIQEVGTSNQSLKIHIEVVQIS